MLTRLYVNNFRCFENFEFKLNNTPSSLLIGRNGVGKSTLAAALTVFQRIGRGESLVNSLVSPEDFFCGRSEAPMRFELEVKLNDALYFYSLALELPKGSEELIVLEERLEVSGIRVYARGGTKVSHTEKLSLDDAAAFLPGYFIALSLMWQSKNNPLNSFRQFLMLMAIIRPIPSLMRGDSHEETLEPEADVSNLGDWLSGLLALYPAAYANINNYLRTVMPDFLDFKNEVLGKKAKQLLVRFKANNELIELRFDDLSDGEKCFFLCAVILAANEAYGPIFCFWDEPDNYLSISEVGHFVMGLRRAFENTGQIVVTSHNAEAIGRFSDENTWVLDRKSHLEPTLIRLLAELPPPKNLIQALTIGDIEL